MKLFYFILFLLTTLLLSNECLGQKPSSDGEYTFKRGDFNGIGKWYMGREIAYVMGFEGINWLEMPMTSLDPRTYHDCGLGRGGTARIALLCRTT